MRLSRQCEIAIDVLVFCARKETAVNKIGDAAVFANTTRNNAHQVVVHLIHAGILVSVRGRQGGIRLARSARHIVVGEVMRVMEPAITPTATTMRNPVFKALLKEAASAMLDTFDAFTVSDLAEQSKGSRVACLTCEVRADRRVPLRPRVRDLVDEAAGR